MKWAESVKSRRVNRDKPLQQSTTAFGSTTRCKIPQRRQPSNQRHTTTTIHHRSLPGDGAARGKHQSVALADSSSGDSVTNSGQKGGGCGVTDFYFGSAGAVLMMLWAGWGLFTYVWAGNGQDVVTDVAGKWQ